MAPRTKTSLREEKETLQHFTHPHLLTKLAIDQLEDEGYENDEFVCDVCSMNGSGARYHCKQCAFDLHEDCATCPGYLSTDMHPNHPLERIWEGPEKDYGQYLLRPCDVCGDQVKGLFYKCSIGAAEKRYDDGGHYFFIHPACSKLQLKVRHEIDDNHPLKLQSVPVIPDAWCGICRNLVSSSSWSYRCDPCGVNIHPQCVTLPYDDYHSGTAYSSPNQVAVYNSCAEGGDYEVGSGTRSAINQVADAEEDAADLFAAMYVAKMNARTRISCLGLVRV
ncbi:hypothetical protein MKW92_051236 [Papaver armeniacum]|nr:hypothetical protein MKW92_051236 [Papaver armeniacum]